MEHFPQKIRFIGRGCIEHKIKINEGFTNIPGTINSIGQHTGINISIHTDFGDTAVFRVHERQDLLYFNSPALGSQHLHRQRDTELLLPLHKEGYPDKMRSRKPEERPSLVGDIFTPHQIPPHFTGITVFLEHTAVVFVVDIDNR